MLQLIEKTMIKNSISLAQYKLKLHKERGMNSELSIVQVAELMEMKMFLHIF